MEQQFLVNTGIPPSLTMAAWHSAMEIQMNDCSSYHSQECFLNPNSTDYGMQLESALSSMVSSPAVSNSNESYLMGKFGCVANCGDISQPLLPCYNNSASTCCYITPLNSPPKLNLTLPLRDDLVKESFGKSLGLSPDPGFAERAAKFSCFRSRSFNGRTTQLGLNNNNAEIAGYRSNSPTPNVKLLRVSSSPSLNAVGSHSQLTKSTLQEVANSQEDSTISEQNPAVKPNTRKRKAVSKSKSKETSSVMPSQPTEKRCKSTESNGNENGSVKTEEDANGNGYAGDDKHNNTKPPEPPKDYIHVRARRGQATDSHSLAERVRREKISERMKLLQNLVPGCNKVTGKALMLDEIINYIQSLQRQVEFLSMKLASVNTRLDFNADSFMSEDIFQSNNTLAHPIFPTYSPASAIYGQQNPALNNNICNGTMTQCSVDPLDTVKSHLPSFTVNHFTQTVHQPQYPTFCEGDLQTIVEMGFGNQDKALGSQNFHQRPNHSHMKV